MNILQKLFPRRRPLDPATFTNHLAEAIRQAHPDAKIDIHTAKEAAGCHIHITFTDGTELTPSVINLWQVYQQQPAALNEIISQYVAGINETARMINGDDIPQAAQILPVTFVVDGEHNMRFLTHDVSASLGLDDIQTLTRQAEENLVTYISRTGITNEQSVDGLLHRISLDGVYDASLIFFFDNIRERLGIQNPAIAVAARDCLLICDADNPAALARLQAETAAVQDSSPYAISAQLYSWQDGRLIPYETA